MNFRNEPSASPPESAGRSESAPTGSARVLLVEDDRTVRHLLARVLEENGFRVVSVADSESALEVSRTGPRFDLVVTDLVLPGLNGLELISRLTDSRPDIKALVTSGYASSEIVDRALELGVPYLEKPFLPSRLLLEVGQILAGETD